MSRVRRTLLRLLATSALLVASGLVLLPTGSSAEEPSIVGWWHRDVPLSGDVEGQSVGQPVLAHVASSPEGGAQLPPPPTLPPAPIPTVPPDVTIPDPDQSVPTPSPAPDGGLLVAADVSGVRAFSGLRFDLPDAGGGILRLTIAPGSTPSPAVHACPALSDWLPGPDQAWSRRPAHDCGRLAVKSTVSADGTTLSWVLPEDFNSPSSDVYDILLLPVIGDGTPFQLAFEKPGSDAFTVMSSKPSTPDFDAEVYDFDVPVLDPSLSAGGFDFGSDGSFDGDPLDTVDLQPAGKGSDGRGSALDRLGEALENPTTRRLAALGLVILGAYSYWQSGKTVQRAPRLLGALAGSVPVAAAGAVPSGGRPRGIGRFARDRASPPSRL